MTMMRVIRDKVGAVINIGGWDVRSEPVETDILDVDGQPMTKMVERNPLPDGAYEDTADIITGWDGGLYELGDLRAKKPG